MPAKETPEPTAASANAEPASRQRQAAGAEPKKRGSAQRRTDISTPVGHLNEENLQWLLGYQLAQASIVTISNYQEVAGLPNGLRTVEYTMLALINGNPGVSPAQLAKALGLSAPYITTGLDKLSRRGLVVREVSESDGRRQHLRTTEQGEALATEMTQKVIDSERSRFKTLTPAEQMMLAELLHKLARARAFVGSQYEAGGAIGPTKA